MFKKQVQTLSQDQFWVEAKALPPTTPSRFYQRVEETLTRMDFARQVWAICAPAYAADCPGAADRVLEAIDTLLVEAAAEDGTTLAQMGKLGGELAADEGYFALAEMAQLQGCGVRTAVSDLNEGRRSKEAPPLDKRALRRARAAVKSGSGKALLRKKGQHVERAFCHLLDQGGLRRATLTGCENLSKRYLMGAFSYNLSLLLRTLFGVGISKQWLAAPLREVLALLGCLGSWLSLPQRVWKSLGRQMGAFALLPSGLTIKPTCA